PTPLGDSQSLLLLASRDKNAAAWAQLPALEGGNLFRGVKPDGKILAQTDELKPKPLLIMQEYGNGRVLAFAGDSTWHWWMNGFEAQHKRFWRQTVLWLAKKDQSDEASVWITLAPRRYRPGTPVEFKLGAN